MCLKKMSSLHESTDKQRYNHSLSDWIIKNWIQKISPIV